MYAIVDKHDKNMEDSDQEKKTYSRKKKHKIDDQFSKIVKKEMIRDYMAEE